MEDAVDSAREVRGLELAAMALVALVGSAKKALRHAIVQAEDSQLRLEVN